MDNWPSILDEQHILTSTTFNAYCDTQNNNNNDNNRLDTKTQETIKLLTKLFMKFLFKDQINVFLTKYFIWYDFGAFSSTLFIRKTKYYRITYKNSLHTYYDFFKKMNNSKRILTMTFLFENLQAPIVPTFWYNMTKTWLVF